MSEPQTSLREVAWRELFPGLLLLRCFRLATDPRKLLLAAAGIVLTSIGWQSLERMAGRETPITAPPSPTRGLSTLPENASGSDLLEAAWQANPILGPWEQLSAPYRRLFELEVTPYDAAVLVAGIVWATLVWGWLGGAITRMAAVQLAREERCTLGRALRFSRGRILWYVAAPLLPLAGVALAVIFGGLLPGLLARAGEAGVLLLGLVWWALLLMVGLSLTILLLGLLFGWPLLWASISVEGTDAFDAISRSYSYTLQRPLHYLVYAAVAAVLGAFGSLIVAAFATLVIHLTAWTVAWGSGSGLIDELLRAAPSRLGFPSSPAGTGLADSALLGRAGLNLIGLANDVVRIVSMGFAYSFFWTAFTAIYLLLRQATDANELDEVYLEDSPDEGQLPKLRTDEAGVPTLDDVE
ncbi:MAG: hypothetical protein K1X74_19435 [Pirellulales bacterium]|nr:hypothetical protein [Pirellulales bacterium]